MNKPIDILRQFWHHDNFRPLQEKIIQSVLDKKDCIALLPTGGGKSVCYQVPALLSEGVCLVISPLISLMQDQVQQLKEKGIEAAYLHGGLSYDECESIFKSARTESIKLLYLSPERLSNRQFLDWISVLNISFIAVDEAHCISQWGHDFRPNYLEIAKFRNEYNAQCSILALTASATTEVLNDINIQLNLKQADIFRQSFKRANIHYSVQYCENKNQTIIDHFSQNQRCGIVYCRSRKRTEELAWVLQQNNLKAQAYHAGMSKTQRQEAQNNWMNNHVLIMVATTAFGMGINKADVRSIVHYEPAEQLESYYQETGRAGRDGLAATALCLYNHNDINKLIHSTDLHYPPEEFLRKVYQATSDFLQIPISCEPDDYFDFDLVKFLNYFKLDALRTTHALRLLGQEGLWNISESIFRPATVQFITDRHQIDDIVKRYPRLGLVATALLRLYSGIFHHPSVVQLFQLAQYLRMKKEDVQQSLLQLQKLGIIHFREAKEGPQLHFHHYRVASQHLILNQKRINKLRENHRKRIEAVIDFITNTDTCRNIILLNYFGELATKPCNNCDVCQSNQWHQEANKDITILARENLKNNGGQTLQQLASNMQIELSILAPIIRQMIDKNLLTINNKGTISIISDD